MALQRLAHFTIRTTDLEASRRFYVDVLGLRVGPRPPFPFPGLWLYLSADEGTDVVHLIGIDAQSSGALHDYLGARAEAPAAGTGNLDHVAFAASGWRETRERCDAAGIAYLERDVPMLKQHQVFISDPSGVTVELNYAAAES
jgi:catechol 2,3-dioxygenase-like lactoylglutathione lyase family enzyme